jgi:hypothetical protein
MTFKDLHLNRSFVHIKAQANFMGTLLTDIRMRTPFILLAISVITMVAFSSFYVFQNERIRTKIVKLDSQTQEILHRIAIKQQQAEIPKFEASMKAVGAYQPVLSGEACLSQITYCFLHKNKPQIDLMLLKQDVEPAFTVQSFNLKFKSSFDYEIFDMLEYIFSTPGKFGYTRLREFKIEQLFESSPIVKGHIVYDQISLTP